VYALGVLLYELVSDRSPHHLASCAAHEVARVICEEDPESPSNAVSHGPRRQVETGEVQPTAEEVRRRRQRLRGDVDNIVMMALRKEPNQRYQTVVEFADDLRRHAQGLPVRASGRTWRYRALKFTRRRRVAIGVAVLAAVGLGATLEAVRQSRIAHRTALEAGRGKGNSVAMRVVWTGNNVDSFGSVSKDGRLLSFTDWTTGDLAVRDAATGQVRLVTHNGSGSGEHALWSVLSPNGSQAAYDWLSGDGNYEVRIANLDGSRERTILRVGGGDLFRVSDWSGTGLIGGTMDIGETAVLSVLSNDGTLRRLETTDKRVPGRPTFSPDGRLLLHEHEQASGAGTDVLAYDFATGKDIPIVVHPANDTALGWMPDGQTILFSSDRTGAPALWAQRVTSRGTTGEPLLMAINWGWITPLGVTNDGSLYYGSSEGMLDVYTVELDSETLTPRQSPQALPRRHGRANWSPTWSPDGRYLLYRSNYGLVEQTLVLRTGTGQERTFRPKLKDYRRPLWRGNSIVASGSDGLQSGVFSIDPETGNCTLLLSEAVTESVFPPTWSADGRTIFNRFGDVTRGVYRMRFPPGPKSVLYRPPHGAKVVPLNPVLSDDGARIAFCVRGDPKGHNSLLVADSKGGPAQAVVTVGAEEDLGQGLGWLPDSKRLLFTLGQAFGSGLWVVAADGTGQRQILSMPARGAKFISIHPDGSRIAFQAGEPREEIRAVENLQKALRW